MSQSASILLLGGAKAEASRLRRALSRHFLLVENARDVEEARQLAQRCRFHALVLVDPDPPWETMREALDKCEELPPDVLIITERNHAETAIGALRDGAHNALLRPVSNDELVASLIRVIEKPTANSQLPSLTEGHAPFPAGRITPSGYPPDWTLERVKRHHMIRVLDASDGNKTLAARRLDISRKTMERKLGTPDLRRMTLNTDRIDEDRLNVEIRKFLKIVGITSQREIEKAVRDAATSGALPDSGKLAAKITLVVPALGLEHVIDHEIAID